jgi:flagellar hook protein FlgE
MLRSLFTGISGLRTHQQMMDVTGNNIANVNTTGFKSSTAVFQDTLSQMVTGSSAPQAGLGGTNPAQVGLGVQLAGISTNFLQGSAQVTGKNTDLMISGDGFFVVDNKGVQMYTRAGAFSFDADGRLVNPSGMVVQGWGAVNGVVDTRAIPSDVQLPISTLFPPAETTSAQFTGNLPSDQVPVPPNPGDLTGTVQTTRSIKAYTPDGTELTLAVTFTRSFSRATTTAPWLPDTPDGWNVTMTDGFNTTAAPTLMTFNPDGTLIGPGLINLTGRDSNGPAAGGNAFSDIAVDLTQITSFAGQNTVAPQAQNGSAMGSLSAFSISKDGQVIGVFSNGLKQPLAQLTMASFNNPSGLEKVGESVYRNTNNSGEPQLGTAGTGGRGFLQSQTLEMSNVDLGQEFTNMIVAQRGFQANSKVISTSDELLQELVNMKR